MAYKLVKAIALKWYKILSYIGPDIIKQLFKYADSIKLTKLTTE